MLLGVGDEIQFDAECVINTTASIDIQGEITSSTGPALISSAGTDPQPFDAPIPGLLVLASPSISLDALSTIAVSVVELVGVSVAASGSVSAGYKASNCSAAIPYVSEESRMRDVALLLSTRQLDPLGLCGRRQQKRHSGSQRPGDRGCGGDVHRGQPQLNDTGESVDDE